MKDTEIINFYNNLDQYAKDKIDRQLIDLTNAKKESRNYCIKVCPKRGAVDQTRKQLLNSSITLF